jgi:para-aminobenzoate synthetase
MRTLLIDNHDSFTFNLFQLLAEVNGAEPVVVRNDDASWGDLAGEGFEAVVLSPGPGRPERVGDFGLCAEAIARFEGPLLGVCLGHQGIGAAAGGAVEPAPEPFHGRLSTVRHSGSPLFAGIPARFEAVRYHSLQLARPLPGALEEVAWVDGGGGGEAGGEAVGAETGEPGGEAVGSGRGVPMAVRHRSRPQWGVQFHPESVAAEHGERLLRNFHCLALQSRGSFETKYVSKEPRDRSPRSRGSFETTCVAKEPRDGGEGCGRGIGLRWRRLDRGVDSESAFVALYGESREAFWLDSSLPGDGARFSFMGDASGPLARVIEHRVGGAEPLFDRLERELGELRPRAADAIAAADLPFEFDCGFAGYLGYELKAECGGERAHDSALPDAALIFADRLLAFDHEKHHAYLLCIYEQGGEEQAEEWLSETEKQLSACLPEQATSGTAEEGPFEPPRRCSNDPCSAVPVWARSRQRYLADIAECQRLLAEGETYEVCLTNSVEAEVDTDPLDLYRRLRRLNPAPHAAYLRFGELVVLSSSPERFLRVDGERGVEAKPIKGTAPRGATPAEDAELAVRLREDEKSRAENLMIADLLRNDLGRVCEVGSVEVPALIAVESFATVHQLVTTVRGRLRPELSAVDAVRACFPAGSMTGAPKLRTMAIIDELEGAARGVYSGAIGWFGVGGGCDLAVTIRTIVLDGTEAGEGGAKATIGSGGAIVAQSEPAAEYEEMLLKAAAPMRAIDPGFGPPISLASAPEGSDCPRRRHKTPTLTS